MPTSDPSRIDRILDVARGVAFRGPSERENRELTRIPFDGHVALVVLLPTGEKAPPVSLAAQDVSSGGLCVIAPQELAVGGRGAILILKSDGEAVILGARVVYANWLGVPGFECGLEFELQPSGVSLEDFLDAEGNLPRLAAA